MVRIAKDVSNIRNIEDKQLENDGKCKEWKTKNS